MAMFGHSACFEYYKAVIKRSLYIADKLNDNLLQRIHLETFMQNWKLEFGDLHFIKSSLC